MAQRWGSWSGDTWDDGGWRLGENSTLYGGIVGSGNHDFSELSSVLIKIQSKM